MKGITITKNILNENSDTLKYFLKDINNYPIYSGEEQIELAIKAKNGDSKAKDKLINSNLRFVITCAKKYVNQGVPLIDLIQAGMLGLVQSFENYDPTKGYKFLSFAVWYIRREILKEIYNTGRTIRYPITYISNITKVKKSQEKFLTKYQREPNDEELLEIAGISKKQFDSVLTNKSYCQSIDSPITDSMTLEDILADTPFSSFSDTFTKETISKVLMCLTPREYKVITEYFGLDGSIEKSTKEIAKELGLGDERIRQIKKSAIKKLKQRCGKTLKTLL